MSELRTITDADLATSLTEAAERGANKALRDIGLNDEMAQNDVRELRALLASWREVRKSALQAVVKVLTTAVLGALLLGAGIKLGAANILGN